MATENTVARAGSGAATEFEVNYDAAAQSTQVSVHEGEASLSSGETSMVLNAAERVQVAGSGRFGSVHSILPSPRLLAPGNQKIFRTEEGPLERAELLWSEVPGASSYHLQVSRDSLMTSLQQDRKVRTQTRVKLENLEEGRWFWRVAALDGDGEAGRYSQVAEFNVAGPGSNLTDDSRPPLLEISEFLQTGSMVIINGRTDPDAILWVDNLQVDVYEDGSFTAVVRLHRDGPNQLEIIAQDPAGNETVTRREAFLEVF